MSKKNRSNIVYSTNSNFNYENEEDEIETIDKNQQELKVTIDRKQRKGKAVTLISNFVGTDEDLNELGKLLKSKCGVGGSAKDNQILIQAEIRDKVFNLLINLGYTQTKKVGG